ncbi:MAG: InlB B-repeat-containing protein [Bacilli bacterium]|nr:InlB B-repeat-containing protein [Bacilli bacterium]
MNKKTLRIAGWALGLSLAVAGIGTVVGTSAKNVVETKATVGDIVTNIGDISSFKTYWLAVNYTYNYKSATYTVNGNYSVVTSATGNVSGKNSGSTSTGTNFYVLESETQGKYNLKFADSNGYYFAPTSSNGKIQIDDNPIDVDLSFTNNGEVTISRTINAEAWTMQSVKSYGSATPANASFGGYKTTQVLPKLKVATEPAIYTVSYDANGATSGSIPANPASYVDGTSVTVLGNTGSLAKTGYSFAGWNSQSDGNGTDYVPDSSFNISGDTVLYAKWEESLIPEVSITSKDGNGMMSGIISDIQEVTFEVANDDGLTIDWSLSDEESIVSWEDPYVSFDRVGADATLTVRLLDNNSQVVASDSVTLRTLAPSLDIRWDDVSSAAKTIFEEDNGVITVASTNKPDSATISWSSSDTLEAYSSFNSSTGAFAAKAVGSVTITANMVYSENVIATDSIVITINALAEPTLVVSTGTGKTSYIFGETLDTAGWTATYTDGKGVATNVIGSLDFGDLDFIGTKTLKASYLGAESNGIPITVTNVGSVLSNPAIDIKNDMEKSPFKSGSMPTNWSHDGAGSDYADSHAPYYLKMDGNGDSIICTFPNDSYTVAQSIDAELYVKKIGGSNSSTFTVSALDAAGNEIAEAKISHESTNGAEGDQNAKVTVSATLTNNSAVKVYGVKFSFNKGSNVGVGGGRVQAAATVKNDLIEGQAHAMAEYLAGHKTCQSGWAQRSDVARLATEYNAMHENAKTMFGTLTITDYDWTKEGEYDLDNHVYGGDAATKAGVNALEKLKAMVSYYNASLQNEESLLVLDTPSGEFSSYQGSAAFDQSLAESSNSNVVVITLVGLGLLTSGGFFLARKRRNEE